MISSEQIADAKLNTDYINPTDVLHEHDDCVRIAYEWLDAQTKACRKVQSFFPIKSLVERWGGRYVSQADVEVAATLHPEISGVYPYFNISSKLVAPSEARLANIEEAFKHSMRPCGSAMYASKEVQQGTAF